MQEINSATDKKTIFGKAFSDYKDKVFSTCMGFVHNTEDAEDLVQEIFIEVYNSLDKFRYESKISTWIYRIAVNKSLNYIRKQKRKNIIQTIELLFDFRKAEYTENSTVSHDQSHNKSENRELKLVLKKALNTLTENQKTAFVLCKYDELSYQEVAEIMNISVSSVESLIHRAKLNLQKKLLNYYKGNY
ncbi:MAG: RNA polymerase sigma factor [Bacteroidales bacterium]|nr:RNA polymerase sigma factor [Bacteroidales bacterium]